MMGDALDPKGRSLRVLVLEPYYGGSHKVFVDTVLAECAHDTTLWTLPARKWKWRMRGAAIWFAQQLREVDEPFDVILANDMLSVADLRALLPKDHREARIVCYFHENQLTYPMTDESERDFQYGFTNITSCLASDKVWFNSGSHREAFIAAAEALMKKMPDHVPQGVVEAIRQKSGVIYPLVSSAWLQDDETQPPEDDALPPEDETLLSEDDAQLPVDGAMAVQSDLREPDIRQDGAKPRVVLWNHRWEYDKAPEVFFEALFELSDRGVGFGVIVLGEAFRESPGIFEVAQEKLVSHILHWGYAPNPEAYRKLLLASDIVVSTAIQENFGYSVVEAMLCGCCPLLPNRLSYPEIVPDWLHGECLYEDGDLAGRLEKWLSSDGACRELPSVSSWVQSQFCVNERKSFIDKMLA